MAESLEVWRSGISGGCSVISTRRGMVVEDTGVRDTGAKDNGRGRCRIDCARQRMVGRGEAAGRAQTLALL